MWEKSKQTKIKRTQEFRLVHFRSVCLSLERAWYKYLFIKRQDDTVILYGLFRGKI
jgi:hypothetical protein